MTLTTSSIAAAGTSQVLTGSYVIRRVTAVGTAGGTATFYDSIGGKTQNQPAGLRGQTAVSTFTRTNAAWGNQVDCGGVNRIYDYAGVGFGTPVTVAANPTSPLPAMGSVTNGTTALDVNMVTTRGLWVEVAGQATVLTIEYFPNISKP